MFNFRPPWLYVRPRQPEGSLPGLHVALETLQGVQPDTSGFTLQPYVQDTNGFFRAGPGFSGATPPPDGSGNPLDFLTGQGMGPTSPNDDLLLPNPTSLLFPRMEEPRPAAPGLQDFEPQPEFVPGFHVEPADDPPDFRVGTSDVGRNGLSDDAHNWLFGYNPDVGNPSAVGVPAPGAHPPDEESFYSVVPPAYDPVYFPEPPRDYIGEALDQIARIYGRVLGDPFFDRPTSHTSRVLADDTDGSRRRSTDNDALDPRFIVPAQGSPPPRWTPPRPPQGPPPPPRSSSVQCREDRSCLSGSQVPETTIRQVQLQRRPHHRLHPRRHNQRRVYLHPGRQRLLSCPIRRGQPPQHRSSDREFLRSRFQTRS